MPECRGAARASVRAAGPVLALLATLFAPASGARDAAVAAAAPGGARAGTLDPRSVTRTAHDGVTDDLMTAGLGLEGLRSAQPPAFADPARPGAAELRRRATWQNYRALIDLSPTGGAGRDFGPRPGERIAGVEFLGAVRSAAGEVLHTVLLQLPAAFDPASPCLVAVASSGSRGIRGALPTAGEWGLRRGCAVVHTDKGTGTGAFDVGNGRALRIDGTVTSDPDDPRAGFVPLRGPAREALAAAQPHRVLMRHAESGLNPEAQWGRYLVDATAIAFDWLNAELGSRLARPLAPANTIVIAAGISNGGGVVLRALEVDRGAPQTRWFDGAVAIEPSIAVRGEGRPLYDYATLASLLQPCAALAEPDTGVPALAVAAAARAPLEAWCADLAQAGDVTGADTAARAADARERLLEAGFRPESLALGALNVATQLWPAIAATYAAALSRTAPGAMPCGLGFAYVDTAGAPRPATDADWARLYADSNGIPPTGGLALLRDSAGRLSVAAAQLPEAARCLRRLFDGPQGRDAALARGLAEIEVEGRAGGRPVVVMHGRADSLVLPVHSSRSWVTAALRAAAGPGGDLRYYELAHAQHFDAFVGLPGMASRYVPTQPWLLAAMDRVYARLSGGAALPPSQVLRAQPGQPFSGFPSRPARGDAITLRGRTLSVPE